MAEKKFFPEDPIKPSSVWDRKYIFYSSKSDGKEDVLNQSTDGYSSEGNVTDTKGKWMLFLDSTRINTERGMTDLDYAWQFMKRLVDDHENTGITSTGSTTSYEGGRPRCKDFINGAIVCFTKDYRDKADVKKAADAIRKVFYYPRDMYYKTKIASKGGLYRYFNHKSFTIYKHTLENEMYERDGDNLWIPVTEKNSFLL